jgi:hypothetical protein
MGEENLLGVNDYITTIGANNTLTYDGSISSFGVSSSLNIPIHNLSESLVIPEAFEKVLKKTIAGLEEIRIASYEKINNFSYYSSQYDSPKYLINLILSFSYESQRLSNDALGEKINDYFHMMYPNIDNYKFNVVNVIHRQRDFDKEFLQFFSRK